MPDGVKIPRGAHPLYKGPLQQVCENQDPESIAISVIPFIKRDIRENGRGGTLLIEQAMSQLTLVGGNSLLRGMSIDWDEQHDIIEKIEKNITGERFHIECATEACRQILIRAENEEIIEDVASELEKERMLAIYKVRVEEAPIASFCKNIDYESLKQLHEAVKYYISKGFENNFASIKPVSTNDLLDIDIIKV